MYGADNPPLFTKDSPRMVYRTVSLFLIEKEIYVEQS